MLRQELHDAMLGVQQLVQSLPVPQMHGHQQETTTVASNSSRRDCTSSIISSSTRTSSTITATSLSSTRAQTSAAVATAWYELRRAYRRLDRALTAIMTNITSSLPLSNQDQNHSNMDGCREDLLNILDLANVTCLRQRQTQQSQLHTAATTTTTSGPVDGGGSGGGRGHGELQDLITSVCFTACRILGNFTSKLSLIDMDQLVDHIASMLVPPPPLPLNQQQDPNYAHEHALSSSQQDEQHLTIIPLLKLLHSNIGNQPRTNLQLGIQQQQQKSRKESPLPLVFPFLGPVESIQLLQLILPVALDTMRRYPWKFDHAESDLNDSRHQNDMRIQLVTFCNHALEQVLTTNARDQTNRDDDKDDADQAHTKKDLVIWCQNLLWTAYQDQEQPQPDDQLFGLVHQEATTLLQSMRDYTVTCMEFASDVVEGALIAFLASASSSSPSAMDPTKRHELWEDVMHYITLALNALQLSQRDHPPSQHQQHNTWTSIFSTNQNDSNQRDRLLSISQSVWSSFAEVVAAYLTELDDPVIRQTTTDQLIRMGYQLTKMTALSSSLSISQQSNTTTRIPLLPPTQQQEEQQDAKAITLFRACEYRCCPVTCNMIQVMLETTPLDSTMNNDDSEWKSVLQAAAMSRLLLFSNDEHGRQNDSLLRVMIEACLRLNNNTSNIEKENDPWQKHFMSKLVQYNMVTVASNSTTAAATHREVGKVKK